MSGFGNRPKILRGAFIEYGFSLPPLIVKFQFNPEQLTRNRSNAFYPPNTVVPRRGGGDETSETGFQTLRAHHKERYLLAVQEEQRVGVGEETLSFELRLDATDRLNEGHDMTQRLGISPELAALEMMMLPKDESRVGAVLNKLVGLFEGYSFSRSINPPMVLFIWGRKRILPVNINSLNITETNFSTDLNPVRATVSVSLQVVEGKNVPYSCTKIATEAMAAANLENLKNITNVVVPG